MNVDVEIVLQQEEHLSAELTVAQLWDPYHPKTYTDRTQNGKETVEAQLHFLSLPVKILDEIKYHYDRYYLNFCIYAI